MIIGRTTDRFGARTTFDTGSGAAIMYRINRLEELGIANISRLPFSIRVLLESVLREVNGHEVIEDDVVSLAGWSAKQPSSRELPFKPARVVLQDFSGLPCMVDLAAMRSAMQRFGGDPQRIQPLIPVDMVIDHSVQVDRAGTADALQYNAVVEMERNRERYEFMRWGQKSFQNLRIVPPAIGIIHQVNLEYLAKGVLTRPDGDSVIAFPDTVVGTDSHTTMINGLGVLGWGVGGLEAEACMLGQPIYILTPEVIGVRLTGRLPEGATATDLALTITQMLRKRGVVEKFVEFFGSGLSQMSLPDRATIANMSPEYGATMGFFPVDEETLRYLRRTGRTDDEVLLVERYTKEQGLFRTDETPDPEYTDRLELDLGSIEPSLSGPKRPQDRVGLANMKTAFQASLRAQTNNRGFALEGAALEKRAMIKELGGKEIEIGHGAVLIAAITSCTNTSNPSVMLGAGLLAKKAVERGLRVPPYVKTSLAPGSRVVPEYLKEAGLMEPLEALGFNVVGYGCTTCIGNSGPLSTVVEQTVKDNNLVAAAVLSGNRNFEGRISPLVKANFLASPPLVVAYALAGTMDIDLINDPIGKDEDGNPVYLRDIWPTHAEIADAITKTSRPEVFRELYGDVGNSNPVWNAIPSKDSLLYEWDAVSTYVQEPPFFEDMPVTPLPMQNITRARVLALLGDSVTTDHISPAGSIAADSPAGRYLLARGVQRQDFNQYGTRRGNDQVMVRGTFANIRLKNLMLDGVEGGYTRHYPDGEQMPIFDAAMKYKADGVPLVVIAGKEYGTGSSRDWAAKGAALLGVKAILAESYERIHRSNLVGMGVLPLQFQEGQNAQLLGLTGNEILHIEGIGEPMQPKQTLTVQVEKPDGRTFTFPVTTRLDSPIEVEYYSHGGILQAVLRSLVGMGSQS